jgi:DNA recombination protein RmuC
MEASVLLIVNIVLVLAGFAALTVHISKKLQELEDRQKSDSPAQLINQNVLSINQSIGKIGDRLENASRFFAGLGKELQAMQDIGKNVNELRLAFSSSKLRGIFGERVLEDMLQNHFPKEQYATQFKFNDGQAVDAIIRTRDGIIPVDSKFPIENFRKMTAATNDIDRNAERTEFQRAVKKHITDISKKYILPAEGTMNFAVMFVPSEAVFYEIISSSDELLELAERQKVLMTSPNTMSYFLHILRLGHERIRIEENVQKVWEMLSGFQQEIAKFGDTMQVLGKHVTNAKNSMDEALGHYGKISGRMDQIKELK